jgi:hypothetical protein
MAESDAGREMLGRQLLGACGLCRSLHRVYTRHVRARRSRPAISCPRSGARSCDGASRPPWGVGPVARSPGARSDIKAIRCLKFTVQVCGERHAEFAAHHRQGAWLPSTGRYRSDADAEHNPAGPAEPIARACTQVFPGSVMAQSRSTADRRWPPCSRAVPRPPMRWSSR